MAKLWYGKSVCMAPYHIPMKKYLASRSLLLWTCSNTSINVWWVWCYEERNKKYTAVKASLCSVHSSGSNICWNSWQEWSTISYTMLQRGTIKEFKESFCRSISNEHAAYVIFNRYSETSIKFHEMRSLKCYWFKRASICWYIKIWLWCKQKIMNFG